MRNQCRRTAAERHAAAACRPQPLPPAAAALAPAQSMSMGGVQLSLRATADKMGRVMSEPARRRQIYMAAGAAVLLFLLYVWLWR